MKKILCKLGLHRWLKRTEIDSVTSREEFYPWVLCTRCGKSYSQKKMKPKIYYIATWLWDRIPFLHFILDPVRDWSYPYDEHES